MPLRKKVITITELQKFIIRNCSSMFKNVDKLKAISDEYKSIYGTELKDDWIQWKESLSKIWDRSNSKGDD